MSDPAVPRCNAQYVCSALRMETGCCLPSRPEIVQQPAKIGLLEQALAINLRSHPISTFNRYDRRIPTTGALSNLLDLAGPAAAPSARARPAAGRPQLRGAMADDGAAAVIAGSSALEPVAEQLEGLLNRLQSATYRP
eukprot:SAG25_NODE_826_length_5175_cov_2.034476_2_plen_138_part_00